MSSPSLPFYFLCVRLSLSLYLLPLLLLFMFDRVTDILLTVEQGRGLPRTVYIHIYVPEWECVKECDVPM